MRIGIVAPISSLRSYCTTEIQYCLPKLIVEEPTYCNFYNERVDRGDLVILDTKKVSWQRSPEDFSIIRECLNLITPSLIVTPSYMYNVPRTIDIARDFLREFKPRLVAGCIEGTSKEEVQRCFTELKTLGVSTPAIPSHIYKTTNQLEHNGPSIYLDNHLNTQELDGLEGTLVTSLPVRLGLQGRLLSDYLPSPPSLTFHEEDKFPNVVERNIKEVLRFYEAQ